MTQCVIFVRRNATIIVPTVMVTTNKIAQQWDLMVIVTDVAMCGISILTTEKSNKRSTLGSKK
jgi:hypothetical protein